VLEGAKDTLIRLRPHVVVEVNDAALSKRGRSKNQFIKWLRDFGYCPDTYLDEENLLLFPPNL
jgi:hypothetical protein